MLGCFKIASTAAETTEEARADDQICPICLEPFTEESEPIIACSAGHALHVGCLRQLFMQAAADDSQWPAACCDGGIIAQSLAKTALHAYEFVIFQQREREMALPAAERLHCGNHACRRFLGKSRGWRIPRSCPACGCMTCMACKAPWHTLWRTSKCQRSRALDDENEKIMTELHALHGYQRCPKCKQAVELVEGCNGIYCRCGAVFCYVCGSLNRNCSCPSGH